MDASADTIECADCGAEIDARGDTPEQRIPCVKCGSAKRSYRMSVIETIAARDCMGMKAKRPGERRPYIEDLSAPDHSRRLGKLVHKTRVIDRDSDRYFEKITDYESGEVIHHCEEPLSQHQGHGSAKPKKDGENG